VTIRVTDDGAPALEDSATFTITVDEVNSAPILGALADWAVEFGDTVAFTATATDDDIPVQALTFSLAAGAPAGAVIDPVTGAFTWETSDSLPSGVYPITVQVTDSGDPVLNDEATFTVTVAGDLTPPVITVDFLLTTDGTPQLSGTVDDPEAVVNIILLGSNYKAVNNGDGTWVLTDDTISPALPDGVYDVVAVAVDPAINIGADATTEDLIIDTTAPDVTVDVFETADNTPPITGTVDDVEAIITVTVDGNAYTAVNNGDGTWTLPDDTIALPLPDGVYDIAVTATDALGNSGSDATTWELTIDTIAPQVTIDDVTTTNTSPELTGTVDDPQALISVTISGQDYKAVNNGDGTWILISGAVETLAAGTYDAVVKATDAVGNSGEATAVITLETASPWAAGSLDGDDDVDAGDRDIFLSAYRTSEGDTGFIAQADYDNDGIVSLNDYREWYRYYKLYLASI
jgi:hypothetical protein